MFSLPRFGRKRLAGTVQGFVAPRHELFDICLLPSVCQALEGLLGPSVGIDVVHFGGR